MGRNEKTKIIAKLQKKGHGAPGREQVFSEEEQKKMMAYAYKRQEELKVIVNIKKHNKTPANILFHATLTMI